MGNFISRSSAFSKSSLHIWKFLVYALLELCLKDFEYNLANMWNEHNCTIVWTFFGIALLWNWNENWPFPVLWPLLSFSNLLTYSVQLFKSIIFLSSSTGIPSPPLALFTVMLPKAPAWITALLWQRGWNDSVKLWAMPFMATQDRWVIVKGSNKRRSTGEGNGNPLHYSCLENPTDNMKMKKLWWWKMIPQVLRCPVCYWGRTEDNY